MPEILIGSGVTRTSHHVAKSSFTTFHPDFTDGIDTKKLEEFKAA